MSTLTWRGDFYNQTAKHESMTLRVNQIKKGNWHWSLSKPQYVITSSGKVKTQGTKLIEGESMCRKSAINSVWAEAAQRDESLWVNKRRIGTKVR